jgi:hypothetical protein
LKIAWVIDQHRVAGPQQEAADQVDRLRTRNRQHELVGRSLDALFGKPREQQPAQNWRASRSAIVGEHSILGPRECPQSAAKSGVRHPVRRQPAAAGLHHRRICIERLSRNPERIDRPVAPRLGFPKHHCRQTRARNIETGAAPGSDEALGNETIIGFNDSGR